MLSSLFAQRVSIDSGRGYAGLLCAVFLRPIARSIGAMQKNLQHYSKPKLVSVGRETLLSNQPRNGVVAREAA